MNANKNEVCAAYGVYPLCGGVHRPEPFGLRQMAAGAATLRLLEYKG